MPGTARFITIPLLNFSVLLSRLAVPCIAIFLAPARAQQPASVLVAAAADLARTQPSLSESFAKATGRQVHFTFGGSGMLARQIEQGAPFDVFLSANQQFVENLTVAGRIQPGSARVYAQGRLALWSRSGKFRSLADLTNPKLLHLAIANPAHAPYGAAAQELLRRKGLWDGLAGKVVYGENVRQALQFAETGNADAVITAWSLVFDKGGILLPADSHTPIRQMGAVVQDTRNPQAAAAFLQFLAGPEGRKVLRRFGFD
ncbi:MAG TPA: molybdate ABC transporter substrate-binding protein [Bryobacteraceae bacterium]|nr:molybdate ABC transporter substrate-binding protein [Bryobacteraceae bacterium]